MCGGTVCRIGYGSTSFLLPLLLQIPLGFSAFRSGLFTSIAGGGRGRHAHGDAARAAALRLPLGAAGERRLRRGV